MNITSVERFFLNSLLKISMVGVSVVMITDWVFFPEDKLSIMIDVAILGASIGAFLIRRLYPTIAILVFTQMVLAAMVYQCLKVPVNTTTSLSIILTLGFLYSVMLKGHLMWAMHIITFSLVNVIFVLQFLNPSLRFSQKLNDMVTVSVTYSILYLILTYATGFLKKSYDSVYLHLLEANDKLKQKASEVASQNKELIETHDELNALNAHLEQIVNERTARIQHQNEILYKYSYTNAHHLRGPVARILGLVNIYKLESKPEPDFIIECMADQAREIDTVIKRINTDLVVNNIPNAANALENNFA